jgi:hypothetical protein
MQNRKTAILRTTSITSNKPGGFAAFLVRGELSVKKQKKVRTGKIKFESNNTVTVFVMLISIFEYFSLKKFALETVTEV